MKNSPNDLAIISGDMEEIQTSKCLLSFFSPTARNLLSSPLDNFHIIFLPDVSTLAIRNLHNIISCGFSVTEELSKEDIKEITEAAQLLSIDITEFYYDENVVPSLRTNQDNVNIGANKVEDERNKVTSESTIDPPGKLYDESSESVIDALLRIFDPGNKDLVETNFDTVENMSDKSNLRKETLVKVRETKRKRRDVSKTKDGKYPCQQCDYETTWSHQLRTHVESKHEGI